jgi:glycosyltransferase involved in cell wall biosynthesis
MRVTMLVRCLAMMRGGGETRHLAWQRELAALGVEVDVIAGQPLMFGEARHPIDGPTATMIRSPYLRDTVYRWQKQRGFGRLTMAALHLDEEWFCRAAWQKIAARPVQPDIVHAHALHQAARRRRGSAAVVINLPGAPAARYVDDLRMADALVADGWAADHLPQTLGCHVDRVPKGVDTTLFSPRGSSVHDRLGLSGKRIIISVGRLVPIKNLRVLIDALAVLRRELPDVHLVHVGEGPELAALQAHAGALGVTNAITFAGYVPHGETDRWYRTGEVFALTSDFDNSPNVVLEAMASGLPIVSTDVGGVRDFVDASGGVLVPSGDGPAVAAALRAYLEEPERARRAGSHNRQRAEDCFSWRASAKALLDVYTRTLTQRATRAKAS